MKNNLILLLSLFCTISCGVKGKPLAPFKAPPIMGAPKQTPEPQNKKQ